MDDNASEPADHLRSPFIVAQVASQVVDARVELASHMEEQAISAGQVLDALVALSAAGPILHVCVQAIAAADQAEQRTSATVRAVSSAYRSELAHALGVEDDQTWQELLALARTREVPFGPTISAVSLAIALGEDSAQAKEGGASVVSALLARVRGLTGAPDTFAHQVAIALGYGDGATVADWQLLLNQIRIAREAVSAQPQELADTLGVPRGTGWDELLRWVGAQRQDSVQLAQLHADQRKTYADQQGAHDPLTAPIGDRATG